ncbi:ribosome biogenesis GTPase [Thermoactinomyces sp. DSM 45891]|uniref:ribosome small subunit-dependent GTPase A n=1 Tax=Thermoactinomyces sp. DSM 45891 TaxID=1761907 RepID=UPI00091BB2A5|nr:ribosome small subunit-dependent GTPase A [Thermoactinomyces sp. DSM 45891]SFX51905.1 ribosome biogenesis GTPase [Thermoactinomyces sp. DSM 45891]
MPSGQIIKAISGFYYVRTEQEELYECKARGVFKFEKKKCKPLVGDYVQFDETDAGKGYITAIESRQTELVRPAIANVTQAVVVCSLREPSFQQMPLDRFLVHAEYAGLEIVVVLTKLDLVEDPAELEAIRARYAPTGYPIVATSIETADGIEQIKPYLKDQTSVFAGQSGVGKSSLLNKIILDRELETGAVSHKIGRGRHTTRSVEIIPLETGGLVADSPGFSQLTFDGMEPVDLGHCFPEFREKANGCRFRGCLHVNEPSCMVRDAAETGEIDPERYEHYVTFLEEIKELQLRRY